MMTDQGDHTATTNAGTVTTSMVSVASAQNQPLMSSLPRRIPMPNPLKFEDITVNWKKFKRAWDDYVMVVRLQQFLLHMFTV